MIPGPRPAKGHDRPAPGRDRAPELHSVPPETTSEAADRGAGVARTAGSRDLVPVSLTRTSRGWSVHSPAGSEDTADLVEGLSLADLVAEEFGVLVEPDRTARRSARGPAVDAATAGDPTDARVAALERTVAQLEHALAARVATERAIGVLAERNGTSARTAFETLRREARSQCRPVTDLAREVLDGLVTDVTGPPAGEGPLPAGPGSPAPRSVHVPERGRPSSVVAAVPPPLPRPSSAPRRGRSVATTDGRS